MWPILGLCWPILRAMWANLGAMLAHVGAMLAHLGAMLAHLGGYVPFVVLLFSLFVCSSCPCCSSVPLFGLFPFLASLVLCRCGGLTVCPCYACCGRGCF